MINEITKEGEEMSVSLLNFRDWQARAKSFEEIGGYRFDSFNLTGMGNPQRVIGQDHSVGTKCAAHLLGVT